MEQFEKTWQKASTVRPGSERKYHPEELVPQIMKLEKKQERVIRVKTLGAIFALISLVIVFVNGITLTSCSIAGLAIFIISIVVVLILVNRFRFRITVEERSYDTLRLMQITEKKINLEKKIFRVYLPLFLVVALTGVNLMYLDFLREAEPDSRILYHMVMTITVFLAALAGLRIRIQRFKKQFLPVLDRIQKFRKEFE